MRKPSFLALLVGLGLWVPWISRAEAHEGKAPVVWAAGDMQWTDNPAIKGAKVAVLWGDPKTGAYGTLKSIPGGCSLALHTHSSDQRVLVVAGTVSLAFDGGASKDLGAGSYVFIPASAKHKADCKAGADCVYMEESQGAFDMHFVEGAAGKK